MRCCAFYLQQQTNKLTNIDHREIDKDAIIVLLYVPYCFHVFCWMNPTKFLKRLFLPPPLLFNYISTNERTDAHLIPSDCMKRNKIKCNATDAKRSLLIVKRSPGPFDDRSGPIVIGSLFVLTFTAQYCIFLASLGSLKFDDIEDFGYDGDDI